MRILLLTLALAVLVACQPNEPETYKTSANLPLQAVPAFLEELDAALDNDLDVAGLVRFSSDVPIDQEVQRIIDVSFEQTDASLTLHVWRETVDTVHLYFATQSEALASRIESKLQHYAVVGD